MAIASFISLMFRMPEENRRTPPGQESAAKPRANTTALLGLAYMRLGHRIVDGVVSAGFAQRPGTRRDLLSA